MFNETGRFNIPVEFLEFGVKLRQLSNEYSTMTAYGPGYRWN